MAFCDLGKIEPLLRRERSGEGVFWETLFCGSLTKPASDLGAMHTSQELCTTICAGSEELCTTICVGSGVGVGMLRGKGVLGFLVFVFLVSKFLGFSVSKFQSFIKVSKIQ